MACFLVSAAEAVVVTAVEKVAKTSEKKTEAGGEAEENFHVPFSRRLKWLSYMLWGGALLLCFEHIWHGEVQPFFPFLTAMADPADTAEMLHEMATVGVTMALLITAVWGVMCGVVSLIEKRAKETVTVGE